MAFAFLRRMSEPLTQVQRTLKGGMSGLWHRSLVVKCFSRHEEGRL